MGIGNSRKRLFPYRVVWINEIIREDKQTPMFNQNVVDLKKIKLPFNKEMVHGGEIILYIGSNWYAFFGCSL